MVDRGCILFIYLFYVLKLLGLNREEIYSGGCLCVFIYIFKNKLLKKTKYEYVGICFSGRDFIFFVLGSGLLECMRVMFLIL